MSIAIVLKEMKVLFILAILAVFGANADNEWENYKVQSSRIIIHSIFNTFDIIIYIETIRQELPNQVCRIRESRNLPQRK